MQDAAAVTPYGFVEPVTSDHFRKGSQWVAVTRATAYASVHDQILEPWFATFAGAHWRCVYLEESKAVLAAVNELQLRGMPIPESSLVTRFRRCGACRCLQQYLQFDRMFCLVDAGVTGAQIT